MFEDKANENISSIIKSEKQRSSNINRGPGETQLEMEKRILNNIESKLKTNVDKHLKSSELIMKQRYQKFRDNCIPTISIIG